MNTLPSPFQSTNQTTMKHAFNFLLLLLMLPTTIVLAFMLAIVVFSGWYRGLTEKFNAQDSFVNYCTPDKYIEWNDSWVRGHCRRARISPGMINIPDEWITSFTDHEGNPISEPQGWRYGVTPKPDQESQGGSMRALTQTQLENNRTRESEEYRLFFETQCNNGYHGNPPGCYDPKVYRENTRHYEDSI